MFNKAKSTKNLLKKPEKGGIPAVDNNNIINEIIIILLFLEKFDQLIIYFNKPFFELVAIIWKKRPNVVTKYINK